MDIVNLQILGSVLDQFRKTERNVFAVGLSRKENDSEHSFELSLMCRFLAVEYNRSGGNLDLNKVIQYALVHDLVEVYAGDTDTYSGPQELSNSKHTREMQSLEKLATTLDFFPECIHIIRQYELQGDEEAIFVKSIDKSVFPLAQLRDSYRSRKELHQNISLEEVNQEKQKKIKHPFGKNLRDTLYNFLAQKMGRNPDQKFGDYL